MLLLKDGVKYFPYEYSSEEEIAQMVVEHYKEIFGTDAIFFDPQTMKTQIGIIARNDGIILAPDQNRWYILEVELAEHSLYRHITPQITKFSIAYEQPDTKRKLANTLSALIQQDAHKKLALQTQKIEDLHKYVSETIEKPPTIAIIIDTITPELDALRKKLPFKTKTTEFKTYTREKTGMNVHIHQFTPLYEKPPIPKRLSKILEVLEYVYKGKNYNEAVKRTAKKLKLFQGTIRPACTRDIGLTSNQFRKLLKDKEKMKQLLTEKFPDDKETIKEAIP